MRVFDLSFVSSVHPQLPANCIKWGLIKNPQSQDQTYTFFAHLATSRISTNLYGCLESLYFHLSTRASPGRYIKIYITIWWISYFVWLLSRFFKNFLAWYIFPKCPKKVPKHVNYWWAIWETYLRVKRWWPAWGGSCIWATGAAACPGGSWRSRRSRPSWPRPCPRPTWSWPWPCTTSCPSAFRQSTSPWTSGWGRSGDSRGASSPRRCRRPASLTEARQGFSPQRNFAPTNKKHQGDST